MEKRGLEFEPEDQERPPPLKPGAEGGKEGGGGEGGFEEAIRPPEREVPKPGWIPLKPVAVTPVLRLEGDVLTWRTGWKGWQYSERDLADIGELIDACGIMAPAWAQLMGALAGLHAAKFAAYRDWKRRGSPGKEELPTGALPPPEGK